jgi:hypothetical protein
MKPAAAQAVEWWQEAVLIIIYVRSWRVLHFFSHMRIQLFLKVIKNFKEGLKSLPFQDTLTFTLFKVGLLSSIEETHVSLGRKPSMFKIGVCCTLLPLEN